MGYLLSRTENPVPKISRDCDYTNLDGPLMWGPKSQSRMDSIEVSTERGRESGDMVDLIILSMIHESLLFRFNSWLNQL